MCGIIGILNNKQTFDDTLIKTAFDRGDNRGPEDSKLATYSEKLILGFKRLAINGLDTASGQPMTINGITLICNGEIYNYKQLYSLMKITPTTKSDCEVIIRMYKKYGFEYTVSMLDGVFSLILFDNSDLSNIPKIYVARDPFGVRPLYMLDIENTDDYLKPSKDDCKVTNERVIAFASEVKMLSPFLGNSGTLKWCKQNSVMTNNSNSRIYENQLSFKITPFPPGTFSMYTKSFLVNSEWQQEVCNQCFFKVSPSTQYISDNFIYDRRKALEGIMYHLDAAVKKRVIDTTDRPIACLLSGGLDSSIITALVQKHYKCEQPLNTFSIGMKGSDDLKHARIVADYLGTSHTEIIFDSTNFFEAIPDVIYAIESYDTTTVRASVGNYLIGKYISENSEAKVIFNGDGSDEVTGGYLYFLEAPDDLEFDRECRRLVSNIHTFDVLRSDRCISSNGLEPRTPFLDKAFVNYYMSLPARLRNPASSNDECRCEKKLLREAICEFAPDILPHEIIWRTKEAFSDGVSGSSGSWYSIIQKMVESCETYTSVDWKHNTPTTKEQCYYRGIYEKLFPGTANTIPYYWMPNYVKAKDSSARTLKIYSDRVTSSKLVK